jgi:hypothetical protein
VEVRRARAGLWPEEEERQDRWARRVSEERAEGKVPVWDSCPVGRGLDRRLGQIGPLRPFLLFFISFPFSFSDFCFNSNPLQF